METAPSKTDRGYLREGVEFFRHTNGTRLIRRAAESRARFVRNAPDLLEDSAKAFRRFRKSGQILASQTVTRTLYELSVTVNSWGRAYKFCNEKNVSPNLMIRSTCFCAIIWRLTRPRDGKVVLQFGVASWEFRVSSKLPRSRSTGQPRPLQWCSSQEGSSISDIQRIPHFAFKGAFETWPRNPVRSGR